MNILDGLNPEQKEAVETTDGALLILAGAGSGKTKVLTHRIAYLLDQKKATNDGILAVTFTNKAAGEMKSRINFLLSQNSSIAQKNISWCGTFHSICLRILKVDGERIGLNKNFSIYDSTDSLDVVKEAMNNLLIDKKDINPNAVRSTISSAKNNRINSAEYKKYAEGYFYEMVAKIYPVYQKLLWENNAVDFDDLILHTTKLFEDHPKVVERYKEIFKYIHIDEYQDTNATQYQLIRQLTTDNICVVGDDDQSIYGFRGADITNILSFEKDYPDAKIVKLERNYRSTQNILDASHFIVNKNTERREKKLWTDKGAGSPIHLHTAMDEKDEGDWVASEIENQQKEAIALSDMVILYRTNSQSRAIEESLIRKSIPYKIVGGIRFYDRKEVKDILAYLRVILNHKDDMSLKRIINRPRRGIGDKTLEVLNNTATESNQSSVQYLINNGNEIANPKLKSFASILNNLYTALDNYKLSDFIKYLTEESGYFDWLNDGTQEGLTRLDNIGELISMAIEFDEEKPTFIALEKFLDTISLIEDSQEKQGEEEKEVVTLMTVHAAKGLEFDRVFLVGMEEMLFPHSRSYSDQKEMEEERRLAYVAITRAKEKLFMLHADSRKQYGKLSSNPPSRFLEEIPNHLLEKTSFDRFWDQEERLDNYYKEDNKEGYGRGGEIGERVRHEIFGLGEVVDINDSIIKVKFPLPIGLKELAIEYARLEKI
jgi:DNA helicase II / ATP-dependent DNA helicase PcrA